MAQTSSGSVLREARERKGYDLNTVARRLRIRPDILRAIESGDFAAMPPRGYTRNMVNAYAKLLGLNPTEIVNMYLDEAYAEQVERARGRGPSSGFNMQRETRRSRSQLGVGENSGAETRAIPPATGTREEGTRQFTRVLYDDGTRFSRDDYGVTRQRAERPGKSDRDFSSHHSGYDSTNQGYLENMPRRGNRGIYAGQTPMHYSASRLPSFLQSKAVLIALGAAVLVIIIIVLVVVLGGRNNAAEEDVTALPVSGISDTTDTESASGSSAAAEVAPTSARVIYSVKSGQEAYAEIYDNGSMSPETITGPAEKTVDVTGVWTITTWDAEAISLTVDGEKAELKPDSNYGGMYAYTVDFPTILKQWQVDHGQASAASATAASNSTTGSNTGAAATSTSNTDASQTTQSGQQSTQDDGTNYVDETNYDDGTVQTQGEEQYLEDDGTGQYYDENGNVQYYDENGNVQYYDESGAEQTYDEQGYDEQTYTDQGYDEQGYDETGDEGNAAGNEQQ